MKAKLFTDGGSRGNPGPSASAYILEDATGKVIDTGAAFIGENTNNVAEYSALLMGMISARKLGVSELFVFADSQLMIRQIKQEYKIKNDTLKELANLVWQASLVFDRLEYTHIKRTENEIADQLVNQILDEMGEE
jgi:ribonuclease HI